jgi:transposase-like protein
MSTWTDELREQAVQLYMEGHPTPDNSMEIVTEVADELGFSPNSVRMILSKAGVYVTKTPAAKKAASSGGGGTRTNKAAAIAELTAAIEKAGKEVDEDIISKLTGKAAAYFAGIIS